MINKEGGDDGQVMNVMEILCSFDGTSAANKNKIMREELRESLEKGVERVYSHRRPAKNVHNVVHWCVPLQMRDC